MARGGPAEWGGAGDQFGGGGRDCWLLFSQMASSAGERGVARGSNRFNITIFILKIPIYCILYIHHNYQAIHYVC